MCIDFKFWRKTEKNFSLRGMANLTNQIDEIDAVIESDEVV